MVFDLHMEPPAAGSQIVFGAALRSARVRRGLTLQELSTLSGISVSALRSWESVAVFDGRPHLLVSVVAALNKRLTLSPAEEHVLTGPVLDVASTMFTPAENAAAVLSDLPATLLEAIQRAIQVLGPERLEGILQGIVATASSRPKAEPPVVQGSVAVRHPDGVKEYVPVAPSRPGSPPARKAIG